MKIKPLLAESLGTALVGADVFKTVQQVVEIQEDTTKSSAQKHADTVAWIKELGFKVGKFALNFAVKLAVIWLNNKTNKSIQ